jgi:hypothetical protein
MNPSDEQDDLWKLLGKARQPAASPFFARNVVREVRGLQREQPGFLSLLRSRWKLTFAAAAVSCVLAVVAVDRVERNLQSRQIDSLMAITEEVSNSPDFFVINDLDDLLASEESSVWLDSSVN